MAASDPDPVYEMADVAKSPKHDLRRPVVIQPLAYATPSKQLDTDRIQNFLIPIWLLVGGLVIEFGVTFFSNRDTQSAILHLAVQIVLATALTLVAVLLAAKWRQVSLGPLSTTLLKLAAISIAPAAAGDLLSPATRYLPLGDLISLAIEFILYFALLGALFDLDQSDTWYFLCVIILVNLLFYFAAYFGVLAHG